MSGGKPDKSASPETPVADTLAGILAGVLDGRARDIARAISLAEAGKPEGRALMADMFRRAGKAQVIGLTGVPGSGKSTLAAALIRGFRARGQRVGVVCVDPSSPFSGGAILGDRVRMAEHAADDGVFIRSMATRGQLGGLAAATLDAVDVLDAAGFDPVFIETVGVGQDEVDIVSAAHTVVVVSAPGLGDDIQAIKAGVLEIADLHVVSKSDRADAANTVADLAAMLNLGRRGDPRWHSADWTVPVLATSAETGDGLPGLLEALLAHRRHLQGSGALAVRCRRILELRVLKAAEARLRRRFEENRQGALGQLLDQLEARTIAPADAADALIGLDAGG